MDDRLAHPCSRRSSSDQRSGPCQTGGQYSGVRRLPACVVRQPAGRAEIQVRAAVHQKGGRAFSGERARPECWCWRLASTNLHHHQDSTRGPLRDHPIRKFISAGRRNQHSGRARSPETWAHAAGSLFARKSPIKNLPPTRHLAARSARKEFPAGCRERQAGSLRSPECCGRTVGCHSTTSVRSSCRTNLRYAYCFRISETTSSVLVPSASPSKFRMIRWRNASRAARSMSALET